MGVGRLIGGQCRGESCRDISGRLERRTPAAEPAAQSRRVQAGAEKGIPGGRGRAPKTGVNRGSRPRPRWRARSGGEDLRPPQPLVRPRRRESRDRATNDSRDGRTVPHRPRPKRRTPSIGDGPHGMFAAMIAAVALGYGPAWITAGEAVQGGAELRLVRDDLPIRGRVLDSQARPVAGAAVRVEFLGLTRDGVDLDGLLASGKVDWDGSMVPTIRGPQWPSPTWTIGRCPKGATTDADGRFELDG